MALTIGKLPRPEAALAAAVTFMAGREPFSSLPFGSMVSSISGAVQRGHYMMAVDDGRVVGFTFWAVTSSDVARRWTEEGYTPTFAEATGGDTVVLTMGGGDHPLVAMKGIKHIAKLYPGWTYRMVRFGRVGTKTGRFPGSAVGGIT
ncbi:MAG: hypothetical protein V4701_08200 [Pseudomonadota bacterium]